MKRLNMAAFSFAVIFFISWILTSCKSYPATFEIAKYIEKSDKSIEIIEGNDFFIIRPVEEKLKTDIGMIFYPGGRVNYQAYLPLMEQFAKRGLFCILVEMPFNYAFMNFKAADRFQKFYPEIKHWYMAGHSLGGAMAASYVSRHPDNFDGLVLLAAYSTHNLSKSNLKILSIYGSNDGVLNQSHYKKCLKNLPPAGKGLTEIIIEGGNHAQFASYGAQKGDYMPEISIDEQQERTAEEFCLWAGLK